VTISRLELTFDQIGSVWPRGHYGASTTLTLELQDGPVTFKLGRGSEDHWDAYATPWGVVVVTRNYAMGYVGVELLDPDWHEFVTDPNTSAPITCARSIRFWQSSEPGQIGPRETLDYTDPTIIRRSLEGLE
jgi:hypothetical protein